MSGLEKQRKTDSPKRSSDLSACEKGRRRRRITRIARSECSESVAHMRVVSRGEMEVEDGLLPAFPAKFLGGIEKAPTVPFDYGPVSFGVAGKAG